MNKLAHYLNFMDRAQAYGLTKEAADDLYKEAGIASTLVQAARTAGRGLAARGNPRSANQVMRDVGLMLRQRAIASKYGMSAAQAATAPKEQLLKAIKGIQKHNDFLNGHVSLREPVRITNAVFDPAVSTKPGFRGFMPTFSGLRGLYPSAQGRRHVFNELREALGRPMRDDLF